MKYSMVLNTNLLAPAFCGVIVRWTVVAENNRYEGGETVPERLFDPESII